MIVQCDGHAQSLLAAFDLKSGKRVWSVARGELPFWSTPAETMIATPAISGGMLIVRGQHHVFGIDGKINITS